MEEKQYPRFMVSKNVEIKMTPQMGIIECNYRHLVNAFGQPSYSKDSGDEFDGVERVAWHIQFETVLLTIYTLHILMQHIDISSYLIKM
jgi:hypothetical protein